MPFVTYVPLDKARRLVDAVNNAKTHYERRKAEHIMEGYRLRCRELGQTWPGVELDLSEPDPDRPLCCGIHLDWEPKE